MWRAFGSPWGLTGNQSTILVHLHLQWRRRVQELLCVKCQTVEGEKKGGSWDLISLCMYRADGTGRVLGRGNLYYSFKAFEIRNLRQPHQVHRNSSCLSNMMLLIRSRVWAPVVPHSAPSPHSISQLTGFEQFPEFLFADSAAGKWAKPRKQNILFFPRPHLQDRWWVTFFSSSVLYSI